MSCVKIAVMGAGAWGRNIVRTLAELGHLAAVCDPSSTCLEAARKLVGDQGRGIRWTSRAEEILDMLLAKKRSADRRDWLERSGNLAEIV